MNFVSLFHPISAGIFPPFTAHAHRRLSFLFFTMEISGKIEAWAPQAAVSSTLFELLSSSPRQTRAFFPSSSGNPPTHTRLEPPLSFHLPHPPTHSSTQHMHRTPGTAEFFIMTKQH
jgi:hypothetical protein